jgi:hypothetical protein
MDGVLRPRLWRVQLLRTVFMVSQVLLAQPGRAGGWQGLALFFEVHFSAW